MATCTQSPESVALARAWTAQLERLEHVKAAIEEAEKRFPDGPCRSPENVLHETVTGALFSEEYDQREALLAMPAPDMAAVKLKLQIMSESATNEILPDHAAAVLADLGRLAA